jgi:NADH:ubiquinone oxidoreductase subunit 2 (subunit N)
LITAVLIAIVGSLIGIYYYFRPVVYAFNNEGQAPEKIQANVAFNLVIFSGIFLSLFLAIFQDFFNGLPG